MEVPGRNGEIAGRTELFRERLPLGPCAGFSNLLIIFSVFNKAKYRGGIYVLKQTLARYAAGLRHLFVAPTLSDFDSILERG